MTNKSSGKTVDAQGAAALLLSADDILIITHKNPDGDTLGSGFALHRALKQKGKRAAVVCSSEIPKKYDVMLEGYAADESAKTAPGLVVTVDCATESLIGDTYRELGSNADLVIDHHGTNSFYGKNCYVAPENASCCEIILEVLDAMEAPLDDYIAMCLYTGISTDTGCFKYQNTTPETHRHAARLMEAGAKAAEINDRMFGSKSRQRVDLERRALAGLEFFFDGRVAVTIITQDTLARAGADESDIEGITAIPRSIEGVEIGITMRETKSGSCKVSVRTRGHDAAAICAAFGGGGHAGAAGSECTGEFADVKHLLLQQLKGVLE